MPKIKSIRQGQRINQGNPVTALSVGQAGEEGRTLSRFGNQLTQAANQFDKYQRARRRLDESQMKAQANAFGKLTAQDAKSAALGNEEANPNGDDLLPDYKNSYQQQFSQFTESITDPGLKKIAELEGAKTFVQTRAGLNDVQIRMHNENVLKNTEQLKTTLGVLVAKEPERIFEVLQAYKDGVSDLPYSDGNNKKIQEEGMRDLIDSAIVGLKVDGKFEVISNALEDPRIAQFFSNKELTALKIRLESEETKFGNHKWTTEQRRLSHDDRLRKDIEQKTQRELMVAFNQADTPEARTATAKLADQMLAENKISPAMHRTFSTSEIQVTKQVSSSTMSKLQIRSQQGTPSSVLKKEAYRESGHKMRFEDVTRFISWLDAKDAKSKKDPRYRQELKHAYDLIENSIGDFEINKLTGEPIYSQEQESMIIEMKIRTDEVSRVTGKYPLNVVRPIMTEITGNHSSIPIPQIPASIQGNEEQLRTYAEGISNDMNKRSIIGMDSSVKKAKLKLLKRIDAKLRMMEQEKEAEKTIQKDPELKNVLESFGVGNEGAEITDPEIRSILDGAR